MCFVLLIICVVGIANGSVGMVYIVNGAQDFKSAVFQMTVIYLISGLFDRLFIDWYWVGKTKAWIIPGTEDMMPYIYGKTLPGSGERQKLIINDAGLSSNLLPAVDQTDSPLDQM